MARLLYQFAYRLLAAVLVLAIGTGAAGANTSGVLAPVASFTASQTSVTPGQVITFDAGSSLDAWGARQLEYRWDLRSSFQWTAWSGSPTIRASFLQGGDYVVRLEVRDRTGRVDETKTLVHVSTLTAGGVPLGQFAAVPTTGTLDTDFQFVITKLASGIGTQIPLLDVRWDWEGDGTWDTDWSRSRVFFHTFATPGSKEVRLQIRDQNSLTTTEKGYYVVGQEDDKYRDKVIGRITVGSDVTPQASLQTWPVQGEVGTIVHFNAAGSLRAASYRFDFEGDGVWDTGFGGPVTEHRYDTIGIFNAVVEARSAGQGWSDTTSRQVTITGTTQPLAPTAKLTARNLTHNLKNGTGEDAVLLGVLQDEIAFSAGGSTDPDGAASALSARWDYEGDGRWDTPFAPAKEARHRYTTEDTYHPTVEILDASGYRAQTKITLQIVRNTPPTARLTVREKLGTVKTTFHFDAGASTDDQSDTRQLLARWDYNGDGVWDTEFATAKTATYTYPRVGRYRPAVQLRDHAGLLATATTDLEVAKPGPPRAAFVLTPQVGTFATNFQLDASGSADPSGVGGPLSYRWDFHAGDRDVQYDTSWQSSPKTTVRYKTTGWQGVRLAVRNRAGDTAETYQKVFIHPASPYLALLAQRGALTDTDPERPVTRAELAKMLVKAAGGRSGVRPQAGQVFTDVPGQAWYAPFAATAVQRGWLATRGRFAFQPEGTVSRAELARAAVAALYPRVAVAAATGPNFRTPFVDVPSNSAELRFATVVKADGLLLDDPAMFYPEKAATRAEAAVMLGKLLEKYDVPRLRTAWTAVGVAQQFAARLFGANLLAN